MYISPKLYRSTMDHWVRIRNQGQTYIGPKLYRSTMDRWVVCSWFQARNDHLSQLCLGFFSCLLFLRGSPDKRKRGESKRRCTACCRWYSTVLAGVFGGCLSQLVNCSFVRHHLQAKMSRGKRPLWYEAVCGLVWGLGPHMRETLTRNISRSSGENLDYFNEC